MSHVRILSRRPGFRRAGIPHPAQKDYLPGELTAEQLVALRAEPNLTVIESAVPFDELLPPGETLAFHQGGEDRLVLVIRACGVQEPHLIHMIGMGMMLDAQKVVDGVISPTDFCEHLVGFAQTRIAKMGVSEILSPERPAENAGGEAQPEPAPGAPAPISEVTSLPDDVVSVAVPASETGEASGVAAAAPAPDADHSHQDTQPAADHAPGAPAEGAGAAAPSATSPAKSIKPPRKGK